MGLFSTEVSSLDDLFVHILKTAYYSERQIAKHLPDAAERVTGEDLRQAFSQGRQQADRQVARIEQVFRQHGVEAEEKQCPAYDGIAKANGSLGSDTAEGPVRDAAMIHGAQLVQHYLIAQYGSLASWARQLGREDCASVLREALEDAKRGDQALTELAERQVNQAAHREPA